MVLMHERLKLKGKTVFVIALIAIGLTFFTVYLSGINYNRSLTSNLYISLGVIATTLFVFLAFGCYKGGKIIDNYPKFQGYEPGLVLSGYNIPSFEDAVLGEGIIGVLFSIVFWIAMAMLMVVLLLVFEAIFLLSLFVIFASLYWVFIRALKVVLYNGRRTRGDFSASITTAMIYTVFYTGWLFVIVLIVDLSK